MPYVPDSGLYRDRIRLRIGDTGLLPAGFGLEDAEYDDLIALFGEVPEAAAQAALAIAARFASAPRSFTDNEVFESYDDRVKVFTAIAAQIRGIVAAPVLDALTGVSSLGVRQMSTPDLGVYNDHTGLPKPFYPGGNRYGGRGY